MWDSPSYVLYLIETHHYVWQISSVEHRVFTCNTSVLQSMHHGRMSLKICVRGSHLSVLYSTQSSRKILNNRSVTNRNLRQNNSAVLMWNDLLGAVKFHWHGLCQEWQRQHGCTSCRLQDKFIVIQKTAATHVAWVWCEILCHCMLCFSFHYILSKKLNTTTKDIELSLCNINCRNWFLILWGKICSPNSI